MDFIADAVRNNQKANIEIKHADGNGALLYEHVFEKISNVLMCR
jgi:hypothetical protein